ncbi:MAG: hypothetical protein A2868_03220 [Candidatus Levybacteria bacterium RIFCSPHIGHO2_01_FULL_40_15b]|nr:MAG: hypothetical protein A2868_03220 [Candidatus Levybacteria bacterium RIFCSPHIGHO2_01_FULL_40_15b]
MLVTNKKEASPPSHKASAGEAGQTIIEATIALASILLTLAAISIAISTGVSNSQFAKQQTQASKYAQGGMEQLRYLRNTDPTSFFLKEGTKCFNEDNSLDYFPCTAVNIANSFKREAEFSKNGIPTTECEDDKKVTVSVYWASGKCSSANTFCHKSQLVSCFVNQVGSSSQL